MLRLRQAFLAVFVLSGLLFASGASAVQTTYGVVWGSATASVLFIPDDNSGPLQLGTGNFNLTGGSLTFDPTLANTTLDLFLTGGETDIVLSRAIETSVAPGVPTSNVNVANATLSGTMDMTANTPEQWQLSANPLDVTADVTLDGPVFVPYVAQTSGGNGLLQDLPSPAVFAFSSTFITVPGAILLPETEGEEAVNGTLTVKIFLQAKAIPEPSSALLCTIALMFTARGVSAAARDRRH